MLVLNWHYFQEALMVTMTHWSEQGWDLKVRWSMEM